MILGRASVVAVILTCGVSKHGKVEGSHGKVEGSHGKVEGHTARWRVTLPTNPQPIIPVAKSIISQFVYHDKWQSLSSWWFQPIWKYDREIGSFPQVGVKIKIFETTT